MTRWDAVDDVADGPAPAVPETGTAPPDGPRRPGPHALLLEARDVPLGGLRAITVRRSLPQRALSTVGAWCFVDRFGPQRAKMRVEPHPHMGLQTVTLPLAGEVRHRDSIGTDVVLRPGQLNLMTSGRGIAHSEYSLGSADEYQHGLQLWVALPEASRNGSAAFERHEDLPIVSVPASVGEDGRATVIMGTLAGVTSPATTHTPIVGAELRLEPGSTVELPLDPTWEHALMVVSGDAAASADGENPMPGLARSDLLYLGTDRASITLASDHGAIVILLGGEPFEEDLVMWWNFVGRSHDDIEQAWDDWQHRTGRFGEVDGHGDVRIPAPPLPTVRLLPRHRAI